MMLFAFISLIYELFLLSFFKTFFVILIFLLNLLILSHLFIYSTPATEVVMRAETLIASWAVVNKEAWPQQ